MKGGVYFCKEPDIDIITKGNKIDKSSTKLRFKGCLNFWHIMELLVLLHILEPALRCTSIVITEMNMSRHSKIF
jgi:hypothetical protein